MGKTKYDLDGLSGDNKDTLEQLGVGYKFSPQWSAELGYADFGKLNFSGVNGGAKSSYVALLLSAPIADGFSVYGRLGAANTDRKVGGFGAAFSERKTEGLFGAGLSYAFAKNVAGTVEYMKLSDSEVDSIGLGVKFGF